MKMNNTIISNKLYINIKRFFDETNFRDIKPIDMQHLTKISIEMFNDNAEESFYDLCVYVNDERSKIFSDIILKLSVYVEGQIDLLRYQSDEHKRNSERVFKNMRDFTEEERRAYRELIDNISQPVIGYDGRPININTLFDTPDDPRLIPKKPLPENKYYGNGRCPHCGVYFIDKSTNYCGNCGQALDWGKAERKDDAEV